MSEKYSFIVVKYPKKETADEALKAVLGLAKEKVVKLRDAVAITKTAEGKLKLHQTKDDTAKKGFLKGGGIGVLFALLFGPVGWVAAGAALGTAFAMFDRGIKDKLLKELGEKMTPEQSALAVLVEEADWETALGRIWKDVFEVPGLDALLARVPELGGQQIGVARGHPLQHMAEVLQVIEGVGKDGSHGLLKYCTKV